jgi:hypothetical protein
MSDNDGWVTMSWPMLGIIVLAYMTLTVLVFSVDTGFGLLLFAVGVAVIASLKLKPVDSDDEYF